MSFDEWYLPKKHFLDDCESGYFECYEAGAVSRQAEVDGLQKRIDKVIAFQKKLQNSEKLDWMCIGDELEAILNEST